MGRGAPSGRFPGLRRRGHPRSFYLDEIRGRFAGEALAHVVVLLGPRGWEPATAVPAEALRADWQTFARAAGRLLRGVAAPEQRWLLKEYIHYLKEEGLSDPDALTVTSALALMELERAEDAACCGRLNCER